MSCAHCGAGALWGKQSDWIDRTTGPVALSTAKAPLINYRIQRSIVDQASLGLCSRTPEPFDPFFPSYKDAYIRILDWALSYKTCCALSTQSSRTMLCWLCTRLLVEQVQLSPKSAQHHSHSHGEHGSYSNCSVDKWSPFQFCLGVTPLITKAQSIPLAAASASADTLRRQVAKCLRSQWNLSTHVGIRTEVGRMAGQRAILKLTYPQAPQRLVANHLPTGQPHVLG